MSTQPPTDWMQELDEIEKRIPAALSSAGQCLLELSKDKPKNKEMELHANHFLRMLQEVENNLSKHINYLIQVSTGQPHEGSIYATQKDFHMAYHRMEHVRKRLVELEQMKNQHQLRQQSLQRGLSGPSALPSGTVEPIQNLQRSLSTPMQPSQSGTGIQRTMSHPEPQR